MREDVYCFGGNPLDRASERREDREWIAAGHKKLKRLGRNPGGQD